MRKVIVKEIPKNTVRVEDCSLYKIYCNVSSSGEIYKLSRVTFSGNEDKDMYAFINLSSSKIWANGDGEFKEMLLKTARHDDDLFDFDNLKEFAKWLNNKVN